MSVAARRFQWASNRVTAQAIYSLWPTNPTPTTTADADSSAVELGTKFKSDVNASVLGVRFYKGTTNTGTHKGSLWTSTGTLLASVTFTGETASGWQQMLFASPVAITANTTYVVSYFAPNGHYANNASYFTGTYTSGFLSSPATSTSSNGLFIYSATSAFPTQTFNATNYWVDVIVTTTNDTTAPSTPTGLTATPSGSFASLSWTASTDNVGVAGYRVYRNGTEVGISTTTTYLDTTTSPSTSYAYTVRAYDYNSNLSGLSNSAGVTTGSNTAPTASFTISPVGLTVYVNGSASSDPDGSIASYAWTFGDGGTATGVSPSHTYAADGTYTITLTVTDNLGATDVDSQSANVAAGAFAPNLINNPHSGGYPDETNTGVPSGVTLTPSGSLTVSTNGTVLDGLDITGQVVITADNVTIRNCRITSADYYPIDYSGTGLLVEDTEIIGQSTNVTAGISFDNYTARRVFVTGTADGFKANNNVLIEDCYVHTLAIGQTTHNDGVQATGGDSVTVRHNTFKLGDQTGVSAVVQLGNEYGNNSNWLIENNLIDGGGWSINANTDDASKSPNCQIINNRFTRRAGYGPGGAAGATWIGNIYDDDGSPA
jgi:chitodextrinase